MTLLTTQTWLWRAILGEAGALQASDAMIRPEGLAWRDRLSIYAHGYRLRLLECLRAAYPLLCSALGDALFDAFALGYIAATPSSSYNLHDLGARFPAYLASSRPAPSVDDDGAWADFMIALARFERMLYEVYDGPGDENAGHDACNADDARDRPAADGHTPALARSLRLAEFSHPVQECLRAHQAGERVTAMAPRATSLALARVAFRVVVEPLNGIEQALYKRMSGEGVAAGIAEVRAGVGEEGLRRWLARQSERGLMVGMETQRPAFHPG